MGRRKTGRIYWRDRGGQRRAYVDLRDLGGGREALTPKGDTLATTDPDIAAELAAQRVKKLETQKRRKVLLGVERLEALAPYVEHHIRQKSKAGKVTSRWVKQTLRQLEHAIGFFGADRDLVSISAQDVQHYAQFLRTVPGSRNLSDGGKATISAGTQRHYLNSLSNLYRRAIAEGCVPPGYNPVQALLEKPTAARHEARWLEAHEAALLLESARRLKLRKGGPVPFIHALIATYLLTGGRTSEVLGLEVDDVSFHRGTVTFRPNQWRRLKTGTSFRPVPLWPQLEEILRAHLMAMERAGGLGQLLFPSASRAGTGREETMLGDFRKSLDTVAERAGWRKGEIRSKMFRHTYCAARLQTLDRGHPVSPYTVGKELGHGGTAMVERVYSHLGHVRHRSELVEFRVEQHEAALGDRLEMLERADDPMEDGTRDEGVTLSGGPHV